MAAVSVAVIVSAWLVGTFGGLHCAAMCGGLVAAIGARDAARLQPLRSAKALALRHAGHHAGRLCTYALLGGLFGGAGEAALGLVDVLSVQRALYIAANVVLLALGVSLLTRTAGIAVLQRVGVATFAPVLAAVKPILRRDDAYARVAMGLVWGLMPCALVYSVLPLALMSGGWWQGMIVMLAFGAGTLPNLLAMGATLETARRWTSRPGVRAAGTLLIVGFGLLGLARAVFVPEALAQGPFCLVP
ncbi:MAG TPA: sulfite exporter TauE/SafE family protein [Casimicrobiaceae bacterium]|nr:sulfite exporter TauE/SafE family protein [Casimicrobiaceae bacterium]